MEMSYRCMKCGNTITPNVGEYPKCNYCAEDTILVLITEANKHKLPHPTHPAGAKEIDFNDPSKTCQCAPGLCPCGKFVSHLASESWDPDSPRFVGGEAMEYHKNKKNEEF